VGGIAAVAMLAFISTAAARIDTTTSGTVCYSQHPGGGRELRCVHVQGEDSVPNGPVCEVSVQAALGDRWRIFKVGPGGSHGWGFYVLDKNAPRDRINRRDRWRILFTPGVRQGNWKIRAGFPRQGEYERSQVVKKYWVWQSD
jgi:hypothetical protein